jgi:beta-glucosidase
MNRFLWGVATSAYQVEGAADNDWTEWERLGRLKVAGVRCGAGSGHRDRWRSDLDLLPTIGANAYRYSVEWSRIEPAAGVFDEAALERERQVASHLGRHGIEPIVTLHHYTHPRWFCERGGWESPESVARFERFAGAVGGALRGLVRFWVTFNEPVLLLLGGYVAGLIPPGRRSFSAAARAFEHILTAHVAAASALKALDPGVMVGMAHNMLAFAPDRAGHPLDRRLVEAADHLYNTALVEAAASGDVSWSLPGRGSAAFRVPDLPRSLDYFGINFYSRVHLRFTGVPGAAGEYLYRDVSGRGLTDMGWEVHPDGLRSVLLKASRSGLPLYVLENGIATLDDSRRSDFLREHAVVLRHAIASGVDVRGYLYWSLLDNFEWLEGFGPRFGLFEVDYATWARRRRHSADVFAALGRSFTMSGTESAAG